VPRGQRRTHKVTDTAAWKRTSKAMIAHHLATVGPICPGWQRPEHEVDPADLTTDHVVARARGGSSQPVNLGVLCRPCNGRKADR